MQHIQALDIHSPHLRKAIVQAYVSNVAVSYKKVRLDGMTKIFTDTGALCNVMHHVWKTESMVF